jgi:EF-hand domain pair
MIRKLPILVPSIVLLMSGSAIALSAPMSLGETQAVIQLLKRMDTDQNGKVSKAEFMTFMSAEFDRLDVDRNGELDATELAKFHYASASKPGGTGSR